MTLQELDNICAKLLFEAGDKLDDDSYVGYSMAVDHFRMEIYGKPNTELPPLPAWDYDK